MFRILCFGQMAVLREGTPLAPGAVQPRRLGLLALLVAARDRAQGRERLASLLWPESDEERARGSLAQALYSLRRDLGSDEAIQGVRDLRLNPDFVSTDVWDFETHRAAGSLERAAECYAGRFLEGFQLPGLGEFDRWLDAERTVWDARHLEVVERIAVEAEKRDDRAAAIRWWRRAAAQEPHNARLAVRLMRALARSGDRAGAIRQSEIYAALLGRDLELPPDPTVLQEAERIRREESAASVTGDWPAAASAPSPTPTPALAPTPVASPAAEAAPPGTLPVSPAPSLTPAAPARLVRPRAPSRRARWYLGVAAIAAAFILGFVYFQQQGERPAASTRRVLVVPPRNNTRDTTYNLVGPMVAEWITRKLSETGLVDVIDSRTMLEATQHAGDDASLRDLALGAGVGTLIVGSVYKVGDNLRIDVRLTDANTGQLIRAIDPVTAPLARPTAALDSLHQKVTGALAVLFDDRLNNFKATSSQPPTWEAYQEFLLGSFDFGSDYESSLRHFRRAMELDSTYWQARLWAGMASSNLRRYPTSDSIFRSLAAVNALLGPYDRANMEYFEGGFVRGNWEASYLAARRMVELAPGAGHALWALGNTAQPTNRPREAIEALRRIDLDRGWGRMWAPRILNQLARSHHRLEQYDQELEVGRRMRRTEESVGWTSIAELRALAALGHRAELLERVDAAMALPATETTWEDYVPGDMLLQTARELEAHGDSATARALYERADAWYRALPNAEQSLAASRRGHARVLSAAGRWAEAGKLYRELELTDSATIEHGGGRAVAAARTGDSAGAALVLERLRADTRPYRFGQPALWAARIAAAFGRRDEAVALLRQALRQGLARSYLFHADPDLASLRGFAPFRELLKPRG